MCHAVLVKGYATNFKIESSFGIEASELYPEVKYDTVDEFLDQFVWDKCIASLLVSVLDFQP